MEATIVLIPSAIHYTRHYDCLAIGPIVGGFITWGEGGATRPLDRVVRVDVLVVRSAVGRTASAPLAPIAADAASPMPTYFTVDALPRATLSSRQSRRGSAGEAVNQ